MKVFFQKLERLGGGGMADVYRAVNSQTRENVAWKEPAIERWQQKGFSNYVIGKLLARFEREVLIQKKLKHKNILPVLFTGKSEDRPFYIMPLAEGNLDTLFEHGITKTEMKKVISDVLEGIGYAHTNGVIHRDLDPSNIFRVGSTYYVADFGIAQEKLGLTPQITSLLEAGGKESWSAPEQLQPGGLRNATYAVDVYSIGKMISWLSKRCNDRNVEKHLKPIIDKCCDLDPEKRYESVMEITDALVNWINQ